MLRNFIDSLFNPVFSLLGTMKGNITEVGTVIARGYDLNTWFGWITILGTGFSAFLQSLIASLIFLTILYMILRTNSRLIIWFKELIGRCGINQ